jgi:hypothetical protein
VYFLLEEHRARAEDERLRREEESGRDDSFRGRIRTLLLEDGETESREHESDGGDPNAPEEDGRTVRVRVEKGELRDHQRETAKSDSLEKEFHFSFYEIA